MGEDADAVVRRDDIIIECPGCGHKIHESVTRLQEDRGMTCPCCASKFVLGSDDLVVS